MKTILGWAIGVIIGYLFGCFWILLWYKCENPSAMDVYQGKTTLEITYRDGVAIDSCVVFKKGKK